MNDGPDYENIEELLDAIDTIAWCRASTGEYAETAVSGQGGLAVTPLQLIVSEVVWGSAIIGLRWEWSLLGRWATASPTADDPVRHIPEMVLVLAQLVSPGQWARAGVYDLDEDGCLLPVQGACLVESAAFLRGWSRPAACVHFASVMSGQQRTSSIRQKRGARNCRDARVGALRSRRIRAFWGDGGNRNDVMSDHWIRVIPTDPAFVPDSAAGGRACDLLQGYAPAGPSGSPARQVDMGHIVFIDAGSNFEAVSCPWCGAAVEVEWWQMQMDHAARSEFRDLLTRTPCFDVTTSLNDLHDEWPKGFARWWLEVMNPLRSPLSQEQVTSIGDALGHPVRCIYVHH